MISFNIWSIDLGFEKSAVGRARTAGLVVSIPLLGNNSHTLYRLSYDGMTWVGE